MSACHRHVLSLDVLLPVGVLSSYSALPCQDTHCQMIHEKLRTNSMRSDVLEWTHFVVVNKPCSHLNSFCAVGVSSGLATEVTLIECNGEIGRNYYAGADLFLHVYCTPRLCYSKGRVLLHKYR
jgi:hypothetical protein